MKATAWYQPDPKEVEVTVGPDEILAALFAENPDCKKHLFQGLNNIIDFLKAAPDRVLEEMTPSSREMAAKLLREQADRFANVPAAPQG